MKYTNDDSKLHFEGVEVVKFVRSSEPFRIETNGIDASMFFFSVFLNLGIAIARTKYIQRQGEKLVVDPSSIE